MRTLSSEDFDKEEQKAIFSYLHEPSHGGIGEEVPPELQSVETYVKILLLQAETRYGNWNGHDRYFEATELVRRLKKENQKKKKELLDIALREAVAAGDSARTRELMQQINELLKEQKNAR